MLMEPFPSINKVFSLVLHLERQIPSDNWDPKVLATGTNANGDNSKGNVSYGTAPSKKFGKGKFVKGQLTNLVEARLVVPMGRLATQWIHISESMDFHHTSREDKILPSIM